MDTKTSSTATPTVSTTDWASDFSLPTLIWLGAVLLLLTGGSIAVVLWLPLPQAVAVFECSAVIGAVLCAAGLGLRTAYPLWGEHAVLRSLVPPLVLGGGGTLYLSLLLWHMGTLSLS